MWLSLIPWQGRMLAVLLMALAAAVFGYTEGLTRAESRCQLNAANAQLSAQKSADRSTAKREAVAQAREVSREQIRIVYRTIKEKFNEIKNTPLPNPLPASGARGNAVGCGLDADRMRQWNAANSGEAEAVRGEPDYSLPSTSSSNEWLGGRDAGQPRRGDGVVHAVPGSTGEAGGVRE